MAARDNGFEDELDRRLSVVEEPGYEDPAWADLPARDLILVAVIVVVAVALLYWWGFQG